jgi:hypothetical protein
MNEQRHGMNYYRAVNIEEIQNKNRVYSKKFKIKRSNIK